MSSSRALVRAATKRLAAAGVASPRTDAEQLLAAVLDRPRSRLASVETVGDDAVARFTDLVERRAGREPLQHLLGTAAFRFVEVPVGPGVFVPRPETELLVDAVLPELRAHSAPVVVDLCAGSGALALAIAAEVPGASILALERSAPALEWLQRNCAGTAVHVVAGDVADLQALPDVAGGVDVVLSNPPYVPAARDVDPEVRRDPPDAVFGGPDGLAVIPAVIAAAARLLRPGGTLALEHDDTHHATVPALLRAAGDWTDVADHLDLAGRPRYATARRAP